MLKAIETKKEISDIQARLGEVIKSSAKKHEEINVGYRGGTERIVVYWLDDLDIWWGYMPLKGSRHWNGFGIGEPEWKSNKSHSIVSEINIPLSGYNRRVAGSFVKDEKGGIYVAHDGRIGGGKKGIGKEKFKNNYRNRESWETVYDSKGRREMALVGGLSSPRIVNQIGDFVKEVQRIKGLAYSPPKTKIISRDRDFREEYTGVKKFRTRQKEIEARCDHGIIVNCVAKIIEEHNFKVGNNRNIDLYILGEGNEVDAIFEIKTSCALNYFYEAIGQLLYHSTGSRNNPLLLAMFPDNLDKKSKEIFSKLGITCITYSWKENSPVFDRQLYGELEKLNRSFRS